MFNVESSMLGVHLFLLTNLAILEFDYTGEMVSRNAQDTISR